MQWVKCSERLPDEDGSYFVIGKMGRGSISFKEGEWNKDSPHFKVFENIIEWLDESIVSFSLAESIAIFQDGYANGFKNNKVDINRYYAESWDVDIITKQYIKQH